jgi:tetratricopeptide (TPR) repeat protein
MPTEFQTNANSSTSCKWSWCFAFRHLLLYSKGRAALMAAATDLFTQANEAFFEDDYDEAVSLYSQAIDIEPQNPEFYLKRYSRLPFFHNLETEAEEYVICFTGA